VVNMDNGLRFYRIRGDGDLELVKEVYAEHMNSCLFVNLLQLEL